MPEKITRRTPASTQGPSSWWERYSAALAQLSLSRASREIIEVDCEYITMKCVLGDGSPGSGRWPEGRVRRGLVMGAVQSGKTASMLGVVAKSLDAGVDMIVILAGTRVALWKQTFERFLSQLDQDELGSEGGRQTRRVLIPDPALALSNEYASSPSQLYSVHLSHARRAISDGRPMIAIVMKHPQHLRALRDTLHRRIFPNLGSRAKPFHLLVLDDEADDGSILDARYETSLDPSNHHLKTIPRAIVDLWAARPAIDRTISNQLYASYIGYTATPQSNFLQADHNPLAPRDFVAALRTPFDIGEVHPRSTTYREPAGLPAFYTGGETYYRRLRGTSTIITGSSEERLGSAGQAFLVASAIRVWEDPDRLSLGEARTATFTSAQEALDRSPAIRSMLYHPSATIADQFRGAASLLQNGFGLDLDSSLQRIESGDRTLPLEAIVTSLDVDEDLWRRWLRYYAASAQAVQRAFDLQTMPVTPGDGEWPAIRSILIHDIVPNTVIKVINSDPMADEQAAFAPVQVRDGQWKAASDLNTIFVSGNVMSRGLTLDGLTTTVFDRHSDDPFADTQMQMQRWFGYRGGYLHLCRLFAASEQVDLFEAYHDSDEAIRASVVAKMNEAMTPVRAYVVTGSDFSATGKLTNITNVPLCPGASPFVRMVNSTASEDPNLGVIAEPFLQQPSSDMTVGGVLRGRILREPWSLLRTADLLDRLRYDLHRPTKNGWEGGRWLELESQVGIDRDTDSDGCIPFFRPPDWPEGEGSQYARGGPYAVAAYLRLWHACLTRRARGLVPTDDLSTRWSMIDLDLKQRQQPLFYIGIRYGSGDEIDEGPLGLLDFRVRAMRREIADGSLAASWGSRNPRSGPNQYLGDERFDYHFHGALPPPAADGEPLWRPAGAPGQILFYVVESSNSPLPVVAFGAAIPIGGPDQFAARSAGRGRGWET